MKRNPLRTWLPYAFAALVAPLIAAWPHRAMAGDYIWDNAGVVIAPGAATTVNWNALNTWNPDGQTPDNAWANAILNQNNAATPWGASLTAATVLNLDLGGAGITLNSFRQINNGTAPTNPDNVTVNIVGGAGSGLTLNQIVHTAGGTLQFGSGIGVSSVVSPYNTTGSLRMVNTDNSQTQLQGMLTVPGDFVKDGSGFVRFGTTGATFSNNIGGNVIINNGTLEFSNGAVGSVPTGNAIGGAGRALVLNGAQSTINWRPAGTTDYVREIDLNSNFITFSADRSTGTLTAQEVQTGTVNVLRNNAYLQLNSGNSFGYRFDGINLGSQTLNIRNGLNGTGKAAPGVITGSGTIHVSGAGGNNTVGLLLDQASPGFSGRINLFEGGGHRIAASGSLGSGTLVLGEASNLLPITYPNTPIAASGSPVVQSNPWSARLDYDANNPTSAAIGVVVNGASQVNMGVVPGAGDVIQLNRFGIIQGSSAELAGFTVGGNLLLPASDAVISHEALGGADPAGLGLTAAHFYGASADLNGALTVGAGTPWKGVSNDRFARIIGGGATTLTVNGGDNNPATTEVTFAALNGQNLTLLGSAGDTMVSAVPGNKFTVAIDGFGTTFNALGGGQAPGGNVRFEQTAAASGLAAHVDMVNVNGGNLQLGAGALGGVPLNVNNGGGVDLLGTVTNALDAPINVNDGGTLVLNDNALMNAGVNPITINTGGRLHLTGGAPADILSASTQPITFSGSRHTVRVSTDNVTGLDAAVPNSSATWEIASTGTNNNVVNQWGTSLAVNVGRVVIQTAGLSTDGGVITNDNGTRFLDAPLTIGNNGATFAASTNSSLVINDTTNNTPVVIGTGATAGLIPVQIGSTTPINGITKTEAVVQRGNNSDGILLPHNQSPQVIFTNGLKSGPVNHVTGSFYLDGPAANTAIAGDITMGENTRLYLGDGGSIAIGNGFGGAAPRRGDLTPLLLAGTVTTTPGSKIVLGNHSRVELGIDQLDPAYIADVALAGNNGRAQVNQAFVITGEVNPDDRRSMWINRSSAGTTAAPVDLNNITIRNNGHLAFQESNTDVRATVKLETSGRVSPFSAWDFKSILNVDATGAATTAPKTLTLGSGQTALQPMSLFGAVAGGITINNEYARLEIRPGASLAPGFVYNDNTFSRQVQSVQNTTNGGPSNGTDHTLSFFLGSDGTANSLGNGTFNINRSSAVGGYVDESVGSSITNTVNARMNINAAGATLFADRATDTTNTGIVRFADVQVNASSVGLATRNGTDLEVGTLTVNQNTVVRADGARVDNNTDNLGAIRIGNVAAGANNVHFQNGRTSITGNVAARILTAGGTSLEFNPGASNTSTVSASTVQVNTLLAVKSGTTNFGNVNIQSSPVGTTIAGLREGVINGNTINLGTANPASDGATANGYDNNNLGIRLDPRVAQNNFSSGGTLDNSSGFGDNQTWVYTGQIFDADGTFSLAENIDDSVSIKINGQVVLFNRNSGAAAAVGSNAESANGYTPPGGGLASAGLAGQNPNESYRQVTSTGTKDGLATGAWQTNSVDASLNGILADTTVANANEYGGTLNFGASVDGWYDIEIRIHNGTGGAGSPNSLGFGNYFGLGHNSSGTTSLLGTDYTKPADDGSMNLFRTTTVAKGNVDVDNSSTLRAANLQTIGSLNYGRSGAAGVSSVVLTGNTTGDVDVIGVLASALGGSELDMVSASGKLVTQQFNLADNQSFSLNSGAGSAGELEIRQGSAIAVNAAAGISVNGGTLRLSNASGTATGSAPISIGGGTLAGNGITDSPVNMASGFIAPGNLTGVLTTGSLTTTGGTVLIDINGTSPAANGLLYDTLNVLGTVNLGAGVTSLSLNLTYVPSIGDSFWPILNDTLDPIVGFFAGLPEGGVLVSGAHSFQITYQADGSVSGPSSLTGGNDVALTVVPETSSAGLLGLTALLTLRRRRA